MATSDKPIKISVTQDEALVLFDWITRIDMSAGAGWENSAEREICWKIESQLEKTLVAPLAPGYRMLVEAAKARVLTARRGDT